MCPLKYHVYCSHRPLYGYAVLSDFLAINQSLGDAPSYEILRKAISSSVSVPETHLLSLNVWTNKKSRCSTFTQFKLYNSACVSDKRPILNAMARKQYSPVSIKM